MKAGRLPLGPQGGECRKPSGVVVCDLVPPPQLPGVLHTFGGHALHPVRCPAASVQKEASVCLCVHARVCL